MFLAVGLHLLARFVISLPPMSSRYARMLADLPFIISTTQPLFYDRRILSLLNLGLTIETKSNPKFRKDTLD